MLLVAEREVGIHIEIPATLHYDAKVAAAVAGTSLKAWIMAAMAEKIERDKGGRSMPRKRR